MKKSSLRNYLCGFFTALMVVALVVPSFAESAVRQISAEYNAIQIYINGAKFLPKDVNGNFVQPFVVNGTTYLPIRAVAEAVGYDVKYDDATLSVVLTETASPSPTVTPTPTPTVKAFDTAFQRSLTARVNSCLRVGNVAYGNLQTQYNDYLSRGMARSSYAQTISATQASIKSDVLVMNGMIVCIRNATTNEELAKIESDFLYYESEYGM